MDYDYIDEAGAEWPFTVAADDHCEACLENVANHETVSGLLCDECNAAIYGNRLEKSR